MKKKRKNYTPQEKVIILKKHLIDRIPVSDLCDQYNLQPTVFYSWQKKFFENGSTAFENSGSRKKAAEERRISELEKKLQNKNEVLSELMEVHMNLKKSLGEL